MERSLPIWQIHRQIIDALSQGSRLVLVAPTGSGKTTQTPQMLWDAGLAGDKMIVVLQPRRVAARSVAARVAWERNVKLGAEVGYQIRFEDRTSVGTKICFVTEGILLRWLQDDPELRDVGVILFDEFHERNLLSDVALGLVKDLQKNRRPDLKMMVMSATLEAEPVAKYLDDCPILISEGRQYSVEVNYLPLDDRQPFPDQAAQAVERIVNSGEQGDILVFMPGMGEINQTINAGRSNSSRERLAFIPLHGDLPPEDQDRAFAPNDLRKVIVSTNVAETSVTIDGVRHVVDSGVARVSRYDSERGISTLLIEEISRASADQRKGRAGRTAPGTCHRLWSESNHLNRAERNTPEIQRADLAEVVLLLHSLGIKQAATFDWLDKPDPTAVERAEKLLITLGAITPKSDDAHSDLTPVGRKMLRLPMHPRYSRMLIEASERGCVTEAAMCAALVSGRDLLMRLSRDEKHIAEARELFEASQVSDFYTLMRAFQFARKNNFSVEACRRYGIHGQTARQVAQTYDQLLQIVEQQRLDQSKRDEKIDHLPICLTAGFIDQLCVRRDEGTLDCDLTEGRKGVLARESVVTSKIFVAASIREIAGRDGNLTLLSLATGTNLEWIRELFPQHFNTAVEHLYDRGHKRVAAVRLLRFQDLLLEHSYERDVNPEASGQALAQAHMKGYFELPLFDHATKQLMFRCNLVARTLPQLEFPAFDTPRVTKCLAAAFRGLTLAKEAQATHVEPAFKEELGPERLTWLDELAPREIRSPDGRRAKLQYTSEAEPELQVKLHECFAATDHPRVCEGKVPVKLWLTTPDGKRIESTTDWPTFRKTSYPKLKPALQKKFPGNTWL
ncbi:MAG TPA: ATP-dependent helicase HrpB [Verrucomicrobiae bacterium]|nr:ATP-dependent helicase HrpB [Verrucomicrobiae bacterium]